MNPRHAITVLALGLVQCGGGAAADRVDGGVSPPLHDEAGPTSDAEHGHADVSVAHDAPAQDVETSDAPHRSDALVATDATRPVEASGGEAGSEGCSVDGEPGECISTSACAAEADHMSTAGYCPGASDIECCLLVPNVADNPPTPVGYVLMAQADVTSAMTTWAVMILNDPTDYPLYSTTTMLFGSLLVLARVEWHPPDFQNSAVHRGVTLYEPVDAGG